MKKVRNLNTLAIITSNLALSDEVEYDEIGDAHGETTRRVQRIRDELEYDSSDSLKKRIVAKV